MVLRTGEQLGPALKRDWRVIQIRDSKLAERAKRSARVCGGRSPNETIDNDRDVFGDECFHRKAHALNRAAETSNDIARPAPDRDSNSCVDDLAVSHAEQPFIRLRDNPGISNQKSTESGRDYGERNQHQETHLSTLFEMPRTTLRGRLLPLDRRFPTRSGQTHRDSGEGASSFGSPLVRRAGPSTPCAPARDSSHGRSGRRAPGTESVLDRTRYRLSIRMFDRPHARALRLWARGAAHVTA